MNTIHGLTITTRPADPNTIAEDHSYGDSLRTENLVQLTAEDGSYYIAPQSNPRGYIFCGFSEAVMARLGALSDSEIEEIYTAISNQF